MHDFGFKWNSWLTDVGSQSLQSMHILLNLFQVSERLRIKVEV